MLENVQTTTTGTHCLERPIAGRSPGLFSALSPIADVEYRWNEPMARHTTFRVGGSVSCLARPRTESGLLALFKSIREEHLPYFLFGGGSNLLAPDEPLDAVGVKLDRCSTSIRLRENPHTNMTQLYVGAGVRIAEWLRFCIHSELAGMEFLVGIPGTIGGAVVMNAGTREGCLADLLLWIDLLDGEGRRQRIDRSELAIQYRSMGLHKDWVVLGACFRLRPACGKSSRIHLAKLMKQRKMTQPFGWPSAGCIFKNPPGFSAGSLIERAGLKGSRIGDAEVSEKHANWIINRGNASARDILGLMGLIEKEVFRRFDIHLEREIQVLSY